MYTGATVAISALLVAVIILVILFVISKTRIKKHEGNHHNCVNTLCVLECYTAALKMKEKELCVYHTTCTKIIHLS